MKKGFRTVLLLSACLTLLAGCASEPQTQYSINTGVQSGNTSANTGSTGSTGTAGTTTGTNAGLPSDYDPLSEEDGYTDANAPEEIDLPVIVTPAPTNTPIPVISGQYSGATPVVIDPIDKPTPTPIPPLSFTYTTYTATNLGITFEGPAGWLVDTSEANSYIIQSPDLATGYAATLVIRANSTNIEYSTDMLTTEVKSMLTSLKNAGYPKFSPSNTATRTGLLLGATGVYANYTATLDGGLEIAGRLAAAYKNGVLYTVHITYPAAYTETYKTNVYDKLRSTIKLITAE